MVLPELKRAAHGPLRLLLGVLAVLCLGAPAQLARGAPWISEIFFNPPGSFDAPNEYIEIRGTPNSILSLGTYLISIEGNGSGNPGTIRNVFDLSGRTIGGNGFLVLLQNSNSYTAHAHASVAVNTVGPGWGHGESSTVRHIGANSSNTDLENPSITYLLIQSSLAPANEADIDADNDGVPENPIFSTWTVIDGVGILDNGGLGDVAYGPINFRRNAAATVMPGTTVVAINFTPDYVGRSGNTTTWGAAAWVASGGIAGVAPPFALGPSGSTAPSSLAGRQLNHIGAPNFGAPQIAGIVVTHSSGHTTVAEGGGTDSYTIALNASPNGSVQLLVGASDGQVEVSIDNGATFAASRTITLNSTAARTVLVRAVDDNLIEISDVRARIVHSVSSSTSSVYPPGTLAPMLDATVTDNEFVLLSELKVNPPGSFDAPHEFIEVRGTPGGRFRNIYVVVLDGNTSGDPGTTTMVVDLTGVTVGSNGLLLIAAPGHSYSYPANTTTLLDDQLATAGGALGNGSISFFLLSSPEPILEREDLDGGDNGVLEELPANHRLIDAVAWRDGDIDDVLYGGVILTQRQGTPDAATRIPGDSTALSASAWFCGDLAGSNPATVIYHGLDTSTNFPSGTPLSPGIPNNTAPSVTPIAPLSGVIGDPTNPQIAFTINDAESGAGGLFVSLMSSNDLVVPDENLTLSPGGVGQYTLTINPIGVGYSTIYLRVSDGMATNIVEIPYAASAMGRPGGVFHTGTADASAAMPIDAELMWVGDDENQILRIYRRNVSGGPLAEFNMPPLLGLTDIENGRPREVDIEAATRVGNRIFWLGAHSHANIAESRTNRSRLFGTDVSGSGAASTLTYVGRYDYLKLDLVNWDVNNGHGKGSNYYGLAASTTEGVDPKTPEGFNLEGLAMAPGSSTTAYIGVRAPIVPATNRTHALLVPVLNFTTVAVGNGPPGSAQFGTPIELDMFGRGFRSIEWNGFAYLIVAGTPYDNTGDYPRDFRLFTWSGNPADQPEERAADLTDMNPEAIVELPAAPFSAADRIQIISDNGRRLWYNDGIQAKFLPEVNFKKFRSDRVTLGEIVKSAPYIISNVVSEAGVTLTWRSRLNDTYRVQYKSALDMTWFDIPGDTRATHTTTTRFHGLPPDSQRFYRVIALP